MISAGGNSQWSTSQPIDLTPAQFAALRTPFSRELTSMFQTGGGQPEGPLVAPITSQETAGLGALNQNVFGSGGLGAFQDQQLQKTLQGDFLSPASNPFLQQTIDLALQPIYKNAQRQELLDRATFTQNGGRIQGSSPFEKQRLDAIAETDRLATGTAGAIANQNFQQERQRQLEAVGQANARIQSQMQAISALALPRLIQDMGVERGLAEFNNRMNRILQSLQIGANVTQPAIGTVSASKGSGGQGGIAKIS